MRYVHRKPAIVLVLVAAIFTVACASTPPDRIAYTSVMSATDAVQAGMKAANDMYVAGKLTDEQRATLIAAYEKFRAIASVAVDLNPALGPNRPTAAQLVSAAAEDVFKALAAFGVRF